MDNLLAVITTAISLIGLGLVAGFSPTLYVTELAVLTRSKHAVFQTIILMVGVASATALIVLFFTLITDAVQPEPFKPFDKDIFQIGWINTLIGLILIVVGIRYLTTHVRPKPIVVPNEKAKTTTGTATLYLFSLAKTVMSVSGVAALFLSVKLIKQAEFDIIVYLVLFAVLLAAVLIPFVALLLIYLYFPKRFAIIQKASDKIAGFNYRRILGVTLIVLGGLIVVFTLIDFIR